MLGRDALRLDQKRTRLDHKRTSEGRRQKEEQVGGQSGRGRSEDQPEGQKAACRGQAKETAREGQGTARVTATCQGRGEPEQEEEGSVESPVGG